MITKNEIYLITTLFITYQTISDICYLCAKTLEQSKTNNCTFCKKIVCNDCKTYLYYSFCGREYSPNICLTCFNESAAWPHKNQNLLNCNTLHLMSIQNNKQHLFFIVFFIVLHLIPISLYWHVTQ